MTRFQKIDGVVIAVVALLLCAMSVPWFSDLGMEYDEAHFLEPATKIAVGDPEFVKPPVGLYIQNRPFTFMTMPYVGALDGWLMAIPLKLFGFHQVVPRVVNLFAGIAAIGFAYLAALHLGGRSAAIVTAALFVVDLEFLLHVPVHFGPFLLQMICGALVLLFVDLWLAEGRARNFYFACFFAGLAFQEKLTFSWFLAAFVFSLVLFRGREVASRLSLRLVLTGLGVFLIALLPVLWYVLGMHDVVFGFGNSSAKAATWETFVKRFQTFHDLFAGQLFMRQQLQNVTVGRFSALPWLFWGGFALSIVMRRRIAAMLFSFTVMFVALNALFPEGGRLHHFLVAYPMPQIAIGLIVSRSRWTLGIAGLLIAATGISTAHNLSWYTDEVRKSGGRGHWSSAIYGLAGWTETMPDSHFLTTEWGYRRQVYFLTRGSVAMREFYFELLNERVPDETRQQLATLLLRQKSYWITSEIQPQFKTNFAKLCEIAKTENLVPRLDRTFRSREGKDIYWAYTFQPTDDTSWQSYPNTASGRFGAEIDLPSGIHDVRFRLPGRSWNHGKSITVEFLDADGKRLRAWWRSVEYFRMIWPNQRFEFGPSQFPDYFSPFDEIREGEPRRLLVTVETDGKPIDVTLKDIEVR